MLFNIMEFGYFCLVISFSRKVQSFSFGIPLSSFLNKLVTAIFLLHWNVFYFICQIFDKQKILLKQENFLSLLFVCT